MKDWVHEIINELFEQYSEVPTALKEFAEQKLNILLSHEAASRNFAHILDEIEKAGYITWKVRTEIPNEMGEIEISEWEKAKTSDGGITSVYIKPYIGKHLNGVLITLANTRIEGRLTIKGLEYAFKLKREAAAHADTIATSKSVRDTNKMQKLSLIATGLVIIATCVFQGLTWRIAKKEYILHTEQNTQQTQHQYIDSLKEFYLKEKTNVIQKQLNDIKHELDSIKIRK